MQQKQEFEPIIIQASMDMVMELYELVHITIEGIYKKYYSDEAVKFFLELHNKENIAADISAGKVYVVFNNQNLIGTGTLDGEHIKRVFVLPQFQRQGVGTLIMDFLEAEIIKSHGSAWLDSSLPAGRFYQNRGYVTKEYGECQLENNKVLVYGIMCKKHF